MTESIKLTGEDFIFTDNYPKKDQVLGIICPPEYSLPEIKQQILNNQEIVDIVKLWAQKEPITMFDGIKLTPKEVRIRGGSVHHLINLIRDKTGITITEIEGN